MIDTVICGDCLEYLPTLPEKSIPLIVADPPYGMSMAKWDQPIDIDLTIDAASRIMTDDGFFVLFGMMPTMLDWLLCIRKAGLHYREHISWIKRNSMPSYRLSRGHESVFIYSKSNAKFYNTKGAYEDVRLPGLVFDTVSIEAIRRYILGLWRLINTGVNEIRGTGNHQRAYDRLAFGVHPRSPRNVNFTNVWSFTPQNKTCYGNRQNVDHPTVKPTKLYVRLIEMLSREGDLILDPFAGSGTTALAAIKTDRHYLCIEKEREYVDIANERIRAEQAQLKLF